MRQLEASITTFNLDRVKVSLTRLGVTRRKVSEAQLPRYGRQWSRGLSSANQSPGHCPRRGRRPGGGTIGSGVVMRQAQGGKRQTGHANRPFERAGTNAQHAGDLACAGRSTPLREAPWVSGRESKSAR